MTAPRLVILDLDGTLVVPSSGATFRKTADDSMWMPRRVDMLRDLIAAGVHIAIATNQGGVGFGIISEDAITAEIRGRIAELGLDPATVYIGIACEHPRAKLARYLPQPGSDMRKPGGGMLRAAMAFNNCTPEQTIMVGDMDADSGAAAAAGVRFVHAETFFAAVQRPGVAGPQRPTGEVS